MTVPKETAPEAQLARALPDDALGTYRLPDGSERPLAAPRSARFLS